MSSWTVPSRPAAHRAFGHDTLRAAGFARRAHVKHTKCPCLWPRCARPAALVGDTCWHLGLSTWGQAREWEEGTTTAADTVQDRCLVATASCNGAVVRRWCHGALPTACSRSRASSGRSRRMRCGRSQCRWVWGGLASWAPPMTVGSRFDSARILQEKACGSSARSIRRILCACMQKPVPSACLVCQLCGPSSEGGASGGSQDVPL